MCLFGGFDLINIDTPFVQLYEALTLSAPKGGYDFTRGVGVSSVASLPMEIELCLT